VNQQDAFRPLSALQETLAAEHAAVFVYGVLGGRVSSASDPITADRLRAAYEAHRSRRDQLRSSIADLDKVPVAAAPAYDVDVRNRAATELLAVARSVEERCAAVYAQLVASSTEGHRRWAVAALTDAAVRLLDLGGAPTAYPGAAELETTS
jgi:hypothetical protein